MRAELAEIDAAITAGLAEAAAIMTLAELSAFTGIPEADLSPTTTTGNGSARSAAAPEGGRHPQEPGRCDTGCVRSGDREFGLLRHPPDGSDERRHRRCAAPRRRRSGSSSHGTSRTSEPAGPISAGCGPGRFSGKGHGRFQVADRRRIRADGTTMRRTYVVIAHHFGYAALHGVDALLDVPILAHLCDDPLCQNPRCWHESNHRANRRDLRTPT